MITSLTVENFCSIREKTTVSLATRATTPTDDSFVKLQVTPSDKASVLLGIFGANASGKTNFLKCFSFLFHFINHSYQENANESDIPVDGFIGHEDTTKFELDFQRGKFAYRYFVELTAEKIVLETLKKLNTTSASYRTILKRRPGVKGVLLNYDDEFEDLTAVKKLLKDRPRASMLSAGFLTNEKEFVSVHKTLGHYETNVTRSGKKTPSREDLMADIIECARYLEKHPALFEKAEHLLKSADLGIAGLRLGKIETFTENSSKSDEVSFPYINHECIYGAFDLILSRESAGTQRLFTLLGSILPVLQEGGVAVIDEMESDLHPHLIKLILDLFQDPDNNPLGAQLIFTCHHVEILNQLAKEQIVLVEKNEHCQSKVYKLSDIKGVRREENYFSNYNSGRYGAIPEPSLF